MLIFGISNLSLHRQRYHFQLIYICFRAPFYLSCKWILFFFLLTLLTRKHNFHALYTRETQHSNKTNLNSNLTIPNKSYASSHPSPQSLLCGGDHRDGEWVCRTCMEWPIIRKDTSLTKICARSEPLKKILPKQLGDTHIIFFLYYIWNIMHYRV